MNRPERMARLRQALSLVIKVADLHRKRMPRGSFVVADMYEFWSTIEDLEEVKRELDDVSDIMGVPEDVDDPASLTNASCNVSASRRISPANLREIAKYSRLDGFLRLLPPFEVQYNPTEGGKLADELSSPEWIDYLRSILDGLSDLVADLPAPVVAVDPIEPTIPLKDRPNPGSKAIAAAIQLKNDGKPVSERAACELAGVDRKNVAKRYPYAVRMIKELAKPERAPQTGVRNRGRGNVDGIDRDDE